MKKRITLVTILNVLSLSLVGQAQTQETAASTPSYVDPVSGLTLNDAIGRALEHEPGLRASRARIDMTRGLREQAALRPNPSLSFSQNRNRAEPITRHASRFNGRSIYSGRRAESGWPIGKWTWLSTRPPTANERWRQTCVLPMAKWLPRYSR